jgi:hypothetical protein
MTHPASFFRPLSGASLDLLKCIAMVFMVCDHVNEVAFAGAYAWMDLLGRGAFPLFAFAMGSHLVRDIPLQKYLSRLVLFALLSQPFFQFAFQKNLLNILFTLLLGVCVAVWLLDAPIKRVYGVCFGVLCVAGLFEAANDFDLRGIMLPLLFARTLRRDKGALACLIAMLFLLNLDTCDFLGIEDDALQWEPFPWGQLLSAVCTLALPVLVYSLCRFVSGARFLPRYALHIFYPGHLFLLCLWRLFAGDWSLSFLAF